MDNEAASPPANPPRSTYKSAAIGAGLGVIAGIAAGAALIFAASMTVTLPGFVALAAAFGGFGALRGVQEARRDNAIAGMLAEAQKPPAPTSSPPIETPQQELSVAMDNVPEKPERFFRDRINAETARKALLSMDHTTAQRH